jgi:ABC-type transport system involved in multi-copper enzyme maturation permease subunit
MRPYLAIIKDSFRAAFASHVLYVLLGLITVLLVAIAPFHYQEVLDWKLKLREHVTNPQLLVERLVEGKDDDPKIKSVWDALPADLQKEVMATAEKLKDEGITLGDMGSAEPGGAVQVEMDDSDESQRRRRGGRNGNPFEDYPVFERLVDALNVIIQDRNFYQPGIWDDGRLTGEAQDLLKAGVPNLNEERSRRLNRLLIADAFGSAIQFGADTTLDFYYLVWKIPIFSTNTTHQQFANNFASQIPWFFDKFVMSLGLLIAILVTANIIPETFDPGSLNLLLSKPISRWGLLVAKFIGGCAFIALCATYLFCGTWLWLGLGMGIWDKGILISIPVYILAFAIYYSVSTLVGIWYRSAILSVILTGIFWAVCFGVGYTYFLVDNRIQNGEITRLVAVEDRVLQIDPLKKVYLWDPAEHDWKLELKAPLAKEQEVGIGIALFFGPIGPLPGGLGPIYDAASKTLITGLINLADPGSIGQQDCYVSQTDQVEFKKAGRFPRDTVALFAADEGPLAITSSGKLYRFRPDALQSLPQIAAGSQVAETTGNAGAANGNADLASGPTDEPAGEEQKSKPVELFEELASTRTIVRGGKNIDLNQHNRELLIYRMGEITVFTPDQNTYKQRAKLEIDTGIESKSMSCFVSYQGDTIVLVLGNGQVITVDAKTMVEKNGYLPETRSAVEQLEASPDGRWVAIVYKNGHLWLLDNQNDAKIKPADFRGQGTISAVNFVGNQIWIADRTDRATLYDLESGKEVKKCDPKGDWFKFAYRYVLSPLYKVFPKPGELYKIATHLSSTSDTRYNREVDLTRAVESKDPWSPLWSGLGFMVAVLAIACITFSRKDY